MISLDDMAQLSKALINADEKIKETDKQLKKDKENARRLREETIPSAMQELGIEKLKLDTGQEISISQQVYASISLANKERAFGWLEDNGFGGLIKVDVTTKFGRDELDKAKVMEAEMNDRGFAVTLKQAVAPQTLKAFLKEQITKGRDVPLDYFSAQPVWTAKIKN